MKKNENGVYPLEQCPSNSEVDDDNGTPGCSRDPILSTIQICFTPLVPLSNLPYIYLLLLTTHSVYTQLFGLLSSINLLSFIV